MLSTRFLHATSGFDNLKRLSELDGKDLNVVAGSVEMKESHAMLWLKKFPTYVAAKMQAR